MVEATAEELAAWHLQNFTSLSGYCFTAAEARGLKPLCLEKGFMICHESGEHRCSQALVPLVREEMHERRVTLSS